MARNREKIVKLNYKKKKFRKTFFRNQFLRIFSFFLIVASLAVGCYYAGFEYYENKTYDSEFGGYYSALVSVTDSNGDTRDDNQPNGDAQQAAYSLESRLNPLGVNNITVDVEGNNFLRVTAPKGSFSSETLFRNSIERSGSVFFIGTDASYGDKYDDLLISKTATTNTVSSSLKDGDDSDIGFTREAMSSYVSAAQSTSIAASTGRIPAIEYALNGTAFSQFLKSKTSSSSGTNTLKSSNSQSLNSSNSSAIVGASSDGTSDDSSSTDASIPAAILVDADSLYNLVRNYFLSASTKYSREDIVTQYYTEFIKPLRDKYADSTVSELTKNVLYDMFYVSYTTKNDPKNVKYGSLIDSTNVDFSTATNFYKKGLYDTVKFLDSTSNYVYDPNAVTKDFQTDGDYSVTNFYDGKSYGAKNTDKNYGNAHEVFNAINPVICDLVLGLKGTGSQLIDKNVLNSMLNYFVFDGTLSTSSDQNTAVGQSFILSNAYLVTFLESYSLAQLGASLFNASASGYRYSVNSTYEFDAKIGNTLLNIFYILVAIISLVMIAYLVLVYRLLGAVVVFLVGVLAIIIFATNIWFSIATGIGTIVSLVILFAINFELYIQFFENIKDNVFNKKRNTNASFNISVKEFLPTIIDSFISVLIPIIVMLWLSSSTLKLLTITLSLGLLISLFMFLIVALILFKILFKTRWFEKSLSLFATSISWASKDGYFDFYVIKKSKDKIEYLKNKKAIDSNEINKLFDNKIFEINEEVSYYNEIGDEKSLKKSAALNKKIEKIRSEQIKNIEKINNNNNDYKNQIDKLNKKIEKIISKIENKELKISKTNRKEEIRVIQKNKNKIQILERRREYYIKDKQQKIIDKINFKIEKLQVLLSVRENNLIEIEEQLKSLEIDSRKIILDVLNSYIAKTDEELIADQSLEKDKKYKSNQKTTQILITRRIASIIFAIILIASIVVGSIVGLNYDYSYANTIEYTFWGDVIDEAYDRMVSLSQDDELKNYSSSLYNDLSGYIKAYEDAEDSNKQNKITDEELGIEQAHYVGGFINDVIGNNLYANWFLHNTNSTAIGDLAIIKSTYYTYGGDFSLENDSKSTATTYKWVTLNVQIANSNQSYYIKQILANQFSVNFENTISSESGAISKKSSAYTGVIQLKQFLVSFIIGMIVLFFYFLLRFKWTYFVAMLFSITLIIGMTFATIAATFTPFGISTIITLVFIFAYSILGFVITFSFAKKNLSGIEESKVIELFKNEIETIYETKQERKKYSDKVFLFKQNMKNSIRELKGKNLPKRDYKKFIEELTTEKKEEIKLKIKNLKEELKVFKAENKKVYVEFAKENNKKIIEEKQKNQYLKNTQTEIFNFALKRIIMSGIFMLAVAAIMAICFNQVLTIGLTMIVGVILSSVIILVIAIPLLIKFESWRIRLKMANKKHVNSLVVTNEEQIVPGIND